MTDAARYAARRERAYARLGNDLLVVRSRWARIVLHRTGVRAGPTFYYFTGAITARRHSRARREGAANGALPAATVAGTSLDQLRNTSRSQRT
jgi:hypothetical protein